MRIADLVFFIAGNKDDVAALDRMPAAIAKDLAGPGMDKHFMLPGMGMPRGVSTRGNFKNPHSKIPGLISFADDHPGGDALGRGTVIMRRLGRRNRV